jgi:hypothetical protein
MLFLILFGLLIIALFIMIYIFRKHLKEETNESLIIFASIFVVIILLIPILFTIT